MGLGQAARYAERLQNFYTHESSGQIQNGADRESRELLLILEVMGTQDDLGMLRSLLEDQGRVVTSIRQYLTAGTSSDCLAGDLLARAEKGLDTWARDVKELSKENSEIHHLVGFTLHRNV